MQVKLALVTLLLSVAPVQLTAVRRSTDPDEVTFLQLEEGEDFIEEKGEASQVFIIDSDTAAVQEQNKENPDSQITNLLELRTKLRFKGNKVELRNPQDVPLLISDITDQQAKFEESNFLLCLHVGTSAGELIKKRKKGFMEGRVKTLQDALTAQGDALGVGDFTVLSEEAFEHYESTRFAGLVMKVYKGDKVPECKKEDLVPPPAAGAPETPAPTPEPADEQEQEVTFLQLEEGEEFEQEKGEGSTLFIVGSETALVQEQNAENPDSQITNVLELRTKLRFKGNKIELRNPQDVPLVIGDITDQQANFGESKFILCLHVGTSAGEVVKKRKKGFMEGRVKTLQDALTAQGDALGVGDKTVLSEEVFEHYESTRFAGLVMKVYEGDKAPECKKEDLMPPPA